jgi:hypothetical protein
VNLGGGQVVAGWVQPTEVTVTIMLMRIFLVRPGFMVTPVLGERRLGCGQVHTAGLGIEDQWGQEALSHRIACARLCRVAAREVSLDLLRTFHAVHRTRDPDSRSRRRSRCCGSVPARPGRRFSGSRTHGRSAFTQVCALDRVYDRSVI